MIGVQANTSEVTSAVSATLRRMAQLTGFKPRTVLLGFAGVVLKTWAGRTKVATASQSEIRARARALYSITNRGRASAYSGFLTINSGRRGGHPGQMWYRTKRGKFQSAGLMDVKRTGSHRWANIHFPDDDWAAMQTAAAKAGTAISTMIPAARRSIGLSRQSVVQIADSLGIDLLRVQGGGTLSGAGLAKARAALASTGKSYRNGFGASSGDEVRAYVDLINRLPYGRRIGMDRTLLGVLAGQVRYFEKSYAKGAFDTQVAAARAYPNLFRVSTSAN
jgi:hypothetical protein